MQNDSAIDKLNAEISLLRLDAASIARDFRLDKAIFEEGGISGPDLKKRFQSSKRKLLIIKEKVRAFEAEVRGLRGL
jgi:hypothetical protein